MRPPANESPRSLFLVVAALLVLIAPRPAFAEEPFDFPSGRAGQIAQEYFEAFAAGEESMRDWVMGFRDRASLQRMSVDQRIDQYLQIKEMFGALSVHSLLESDGNSLSLLAESQTGAGYLQLDFVVQESVPFKLSSLRIQPTGPPGDAGVGEWTDLADLLRQTCELRGIPGMAAAIIEDGKIAELAVAGTRTLGGSDAIETGDRFHIGSVTKSMTATVIGDLIEEGLLDWETTVGEILPDLEMLDAYGEVTVSQLLRHRGGVQPYTLLSDEDAHRLDALPGDSKQRRMGFVAEALSQEPVSPAGTSMSYTNAGFVLLGVLAEMASRKPWEELMRERVFDPLGMESAHFGWPATEESPEQPRGHFGTPPKLRVREFDEYELGDYLAPAGDVSCSVGDLARYAIAHLEALRGGDGPLSAATVQRLHDPGPYDDDNKYGGGWVISATPSGELCHWHNGSAGTFFSMVWLLPETDRGGIVLMNSGAMSNDGVARELLQAALGE